MTPIAVALLALGACVRSGSVPDPVDRPRPAPDPADPPVAPPERDPAPRVDPVEVPPISSASASAPLFADDPLQVFEIELGPAEFDALLADPDTWVPGALVYAGLRYAPVGVRVKGENSFQPIDQKPSLKIDLDRYAELELLGLRGLTLDNMDDDPSMVHERLAYRAYRAFGVPAARCTHAVVYLNGALYGLYAHVEDVDPVMTEAWFTDAGGSMFEVHDVDFEPGFTPADFGIDFGPGDPTNLQGVFDAVANPDPAAAIAALELHMDLDSWIDYWAVSAVVGQFDSYPYGHPGDDTHLYDDPTSGVLHWLPHGLDETFQDPARDVRANIHGEVGKLCLADLDCAERFRQRIYDVLDLVEADDLAGYAADVIAQVAPLVEADPRRPYDAETVAAAQEGVLGFIRDRRAALEAQLGPR